MRSLLLLLVFGLSSIQLSAVPIDPRTNMDQFLEEAVQSGLLRDGFPKELASRLTENRDLWVGKCPICMPVERGFRKYVTESRASVKRRVSAKKLAALGSEDVITVKRTLQELVTSYTRKYYKVLQMNKAQRTAMAEQLAQGREQGMERANGGDDFFCASCDGACSIKPKKKK